MVAGSPCRITTLVRLAGLTLDALTHDVIPADGAVVRLRFRAHNANADTLVTVKRCLGVAGLLGFGLA